MIGVYKIENKINHKCYIGSTTQSFEKRLQHHLFSLRAGTHKNIHLQHAFDKYGEDNFEFSIVEICKEKDSVLDREQYWIDKYDFEELYNINPYATGGLQFPQECIDRRVETNKNNWKTTSERYKLWKSGRIDTDDLNDNERKLFSEWIKPPWNKGKHYESTNHLKVPKKKKGSRMNDKIAKRNNLPAIDVYDIDMNYLCSFRSSKDCEEWSKTPANNLPIKSRFKGEERMGVKHTTLQSVSINKSCNHGTSYKNLYFKYQTTAPCDGNITCVSGNIGKDCDVDTEITE